MFASMIMYIYINRKNQISYYPFVLCTIIIIFCFYKISCLFKRKLLFKKGTLKVSDFENMDGIDFEDITCEMLVANGFDIAENTQASVDFGVDILARKDGISYAIQCKRYNTPVGIDAVQQIYAGKAYYECHVAVVFTNQTFTSNARKLADKTGVILWDKDKLNELL